MKTKFEIGDKTYSILMLGGTPKFSCGNMKITEINIFLDKNNNKKIKYKCVLSNENDKDFNAFFSYNEFIFEDKIYKTIKEAEKGVLAELKRSINDYLTKELVGDKKETVKNSNTKGG